jgi:hypothetical protein
MTTHNKIQRTEKDEIEYWSSRIRIIPFNNPIGLNIIHKYGYIDGEALGKRKIGRTEPIGQLGISQSKYVTYGKPGVGLGDKIGRRKLNDYNLYEWFIKSKDVVNISINEEDLLYLSDDDKNLEIDKNIEDEVFDVNVEGPQKGILDRASERTDSPSCSQINVVPKKKRIRKRRSRKSKGQNVIESHSSSQTVPLMSIIFDK